MPRPTLRTVLPAIALIALALAAWLIFRSQPDTRGTVPARTPPTVPSALAGPGSVSGSGLIEPSSEVIAVGVVVPGIVTAVPVHVGDRVTAGTVLFRLDDRDAQAAVVERRAAVAYAERALAVGRVDAATAERQLALYTSIDDKRAVAEQQLIDRRAARDAAAARIALAEADIAAPARSWRAPKSRSPSGDPRAPRRHDPSGPHAPRTICDQQRSKPRQHGETVPLNVRIDIDENEVRGSMPPQPRSSRRAATRPGG